VKLRGRGNVAQAKACVTAARVLAIRAVSPVDKCVRGAVRRECEIPNIDRRRRCGPFLLQVPRKHISIFLDAISIIGVYPAEWAERRAQISSTAVSLAPGWFYNWVLGRRQS